MSADQQVAVDTVKTTAADRLIERRGSSPDAPMRINPCGVETVVGLVSFRIDQPCHRTGVGIEKMQPPLTAGDKLAVVGEGKAGRHNR